jgi:hypothetical protein
LKVIIAGSRTLDLVKDKVFVYTQLDRDFGKVISKVTVLCGMAAGADKLGWLWAKDRDVPVEEYPADWDTHGNAAGPIRNGQMADVGSHCIVFQRDKSRGSQDMINKALSKGLWLRVVNMDIK